MTELEMLCFDVLGDFLDPKDILVKSDQTQVVAFWDRKAPYATIHREWRMATEGTKFEGVLLTLLG